MAGLVNKLYAKKEPLMPPDPDLLFNNTDPDNIPPENMYGTFSHIFKFLTLSNNLTPLQSLVKIKESPETVAQLNNIYGELNEPDYKTFKAKLIRTYNKIDGFSTGLGRKKIGDNKFTFQFDDNTAEGKLRNMAANRNTTGCRALQIQGQPRPTITSHKLFKEGTSVSDFIQIAPEIVDAVSNYTLANLRDTNLYNVPIYFIVKTDGIAAAAHVTAFIYFKNSFYSFGIGVGAGGNNSADQSDLTAETLGEPPASILFPVDDIAMFSDRGLRGNDLYTTRLRDISRRLQEWDRSVDKDETVHDQIFRDLGKIKRMPWVGTSIIDMGVLTQTHIDKFNEVLKKVDNINIDFCITPVAGVANKYELIAYNSPYINMKTSYAQICRPIGMGKKNLEAGVPKVMNCTSGIEFIFQSTLSCSGTPSTINIENTVSDSTSSRLLKNYGLRYIVVPGNCRRQTVFINATTGEVIENDKPLTKNEIHEMFKQIYYNKIATENRKFRKRRAKRISLGEFMLDNSLPIYPILMDYFTNKRKCEKLVPNIKMKQFIKQSRPGIVKFTSPVTEASCVELFTPPFEARDVSKDINEPEPEPEPEKSYRDWLISFFTGAPSKEEDEEVEEGGGSKRKTFKRKTNRGKTVKRKINRR